MAADRGLEGEALFQETSVTTKRDADEFVASVLEVCHLETAARTDRLAQMYLRAKAHAEMAQFVDDPDIGRAMKNFEALLVALSRSTVITRANDPADIWWQMNVIRSRLERMRRDD